MKTTPYNPFDYLETPEEISAFMDEAFADPDPRIALVALGHLAKKRGMSKVAKDAGVPRESLYKALSGERNPGFDTVLKVIHALGINLHATA
jgi:probable addiction module antidote protein